MTPPYLKTCTSPAASDNSHCCLVTLVSIDQKSGCASTLFRLEPKQVRLWRGNIWLCHSFHYTLASETLLNRGILIPMVTALIAIIHLALETVEDGGCQLSSTFTYISHGSPAEHTKCFSILCHSLTPLSFDITLLLTKLQPSGLFPKFSQPPFNHHQSKNSFIKKHPFPLLNPAFPQHIRRRQKLYPLLNNID